MKRTSQIMLPIATIAIFAFCSYASADLIPASVDYEYSATQQNGTWTELVDPGNYGSPSWFTLPFSADQWVGIPNSAQPSKVKHFWLEVQWQNDLTAPPDPLLWAAQGYTITGGANPVHVNNGYVWEWTITPQPNSEMLEFNTAFPWISANNHVTNIVVASKCVPEPSTLALLVSMGAVAFVGLGWKRRRVG
jgi:hypothetical protein